MTTPVAGAKDHVVSGCSRWIVDVDERIFFRRTCRCWRKYRARRSCSQCQILVFTRTSAEFTTLYLRADLFLRRFITFVRVRNII